VYRLAPVDSPNKPIGSMTKLLKMKRRALMVLAIYLALSVFLVFMSNYKDNAAYISYCLSLLFGIIWQVFTLTKIGSFVLTRVENSTISKERRLD
jgi:accessory gene regulator B